MTTPRILIAGIGNIFLGDDAFGVEVAQRLVQRPLPAGVRVVDFGIRGLDLTYALLDGQDVVILVDAVPRGGPPGTLYVIDPETKGQSEPGSADLLIETHNLDPARVLRLASALGAQVGRLLLVGCEPQTPGPEDEMRMGLSDPVQKAVDEAVPLIESLVARILQGECPALAR
jgi:hydrogenase maturation protease